MDGGQDNHEKIKMGDHDIENWKTKLKSNKIIKKKGMIK